MGYIGKEDASDGKEGSKDGGKDGSTDSWIPQLEEPMETKELEPLDLNYSLEKTYPKPGNIFCF